MVNRLKMAMIDVIRTLKAQNWSNRKIARELGINRETVGKYVRLIEQEKAENSTNSSQSLPPDHPKPANVITGSASNETESKPANMITGSAEVFPSDFHRPNDIQGGPQTQEPGREGPGAPGPSRSICTPFAKQIQMKVEQGLSAQRIFQDLVTEHQFTGSYHSVRRYINDLKDKLPLPFRRLECLPGEEAQVDFGMAAPVIDSQGKRRRPHVFRIVLSYSRKGYSEAVYRQSTDAFITCLENAFWHFGGVPKTIITDNLKAAVPKADWYDPDIHPKVRSFCEHYGTVILPTRPYTPRHKGKVERGIDYVQENALRGRVFDTLVSQNDFLAHWEKTVADTRIHGTTRKQVAKQFIDIERDVLLSLPQERFALFHEALRAVHRDGHISVDKSYYSVPPEYLGQRLWVRWDSRLVRIFNQRMEQIALHARQEPGRFSTQKNHIASEKISSVERGASDLLRRASQIGPQTLRWAQAVIEQRGVQGIRVLVGLLALANHHPYHNLEAACHTAVSYGSLRLKTIRQLLQHRQPKQEEFAFMEQHPIIRDLGEYDQLVFNAFRKEQLP